MIVDPWTVGRVDLDAKGQKIAVHLEYEEGQRRLKAMAMDMSKAFIAAAQEALPRPEETM